MAGEDPGTGVITLILDLIQRGWSAVTGAAKSVVSGTVDIIKTSLFFSWRRKMMQGQMGPDLVHGQQSLKDLRLHEQVGAKIVTVEIGDETAMEALREELRRLELDFAITEHDGQYTLHYKESNEQDVLYAQQAALEKLYGGHEQDEQGQETPEDPDDRDQQDREERQDDGREREERDNGRREEPAPTPIPVEVGEQQSAPADKASRGKHARQAEPALAEKGLSASPRTQRTSEAPSLAERMPLTPSQSQRAPQTQAQAKDAPQFEPLDSLIAKARERAAAKNAARKQDLSLDRNHNRVRAREVNFGH